MTAAEVVRLALRTSIFLIVFSLGLRATRADVLYLLSRPGRLARSLLAMNVIMPLVAVGLSLAFNLHPAVKTALPHPALKVKSRGARSRAGLIA